MNRYIYGLIFSLTLLLNTSGLVCSGQSAEKEQEQEEAVKSKTEKKHRRVLSIEQLDNLEALMATGKPGKRHAKSLTSSRQFDETEIKELLKELDALNNHNVEQDIPDTKS